MKEKEKVGIIGCGWLGFPLGRKLIANFQVIGTTTTANKVPLFNEKGIEGIVYNCLIDSFPSPLLSCKVIIIAVPPKSRSTDGLWFVKAIKAILRAIAESEVEKVIFLSSSSIYPDSIIGSVDENFPINENSNGNNALFLAEREMEEFSKTTYILRLSGLTGGNRLLAKHFAGKENIKGGSLPVNLIHLQDAVNIIELFVKMEVEKGVYNICSPKHPSKEELYTKDCIRFGLTIPKFEIVPQQGKLIDINKLIKTFGYKFIYPDPLHFTYDFH